ncbi:MAG: hypothetical protein II723_06030 [Oscillospiraceae bacterium]|nr:hypothetical protein [Oscillospiraceae bacterium]
MNLKKAVGYTADVLMYAVMAVQLLYAFTGNTLHELLGIVFFLCLTVHIVIKRRWLRSLRNSGTRPPARRFFNIVTVLLFVCVPVLAVSSMGVSRTVFPWFPYLGSADLHRDLATAVLTLSVVHGGMHGYLRTQHKKRAGILIALGAAASVAAGTALVPYLNRHFKTVRIEYAAAVQGEKLHPDTRPLTVYFTRIGNTDFAQNVDAVSGASLLLADGRLMGNTELLADMVADAVPCDVQAITLTGEHYPSGYGATVSAAGRELRQNARPAIEPIDISGSDEIILIYPIWWGTVPMPVASFLEQHDWTGKQLRLIATQGSSGFVSSTRDIRRMAAGAEVTELVSIYCDDIPSARQQITDCLKSIYP